MENMKKGLYAIFGFVMFLVVVSFGYQMLAKGFNTGGLNGGNLVVSGQPAIDFKVEDVDGNQVSLSDFTGKPIVVNFWASWCPPCKSEMPHFNEVFKEYGDKVDFLMIDLVDGSRETVEAGKSFIEDNGYVFPVYFDKTQDAAIAYGIYSIPTTIFIDSEGKIVKSYTGALSKDELIKEIEDIMK